MGRTSVSGSSSTMAARPRQRIGDRLHESERLRASGRRRPGVRGPNRPPPSGERGRLHLVDDDGRRIRARNEPGSRSGPVRLARQVQGHVGVLGESLRIRLVFPVCRAPVSTTTGRVLRRSGSTSRINPYCKFLKNLRIHAPVGVEFRAIAPLDASPPNRVPSLPISGKRRSRASPASAAPGPIHVSERHCRTAGRTSPSGVQSPSCARGCYARAGNQGSLMRSRG